MEKWYSTFKFYDDRGRRLSLFARKTDVISEKETIHQLEIFILTCSKKDRFLKEKAKTIYQFWLTYGDNFNIQYQLLSGKQESFHPQIIKVPLPEPHQPKKTFLEWCKKTYFREANFSIQIPMRLYREDIRLVKEPTTFNKMRVYAKFKCFTR